MDNEVRLDIIHGYPHGIAASNSNPALSWSVNEVKKKLPYIGGWKRRESTIIPEGYVEIAFLCKRCVYKAASLWHKSRIRRINTKVVEHIMAGRPKTREKRRLMEEAKRNEGIAPSADAAANEAIREESAGAPVAATSAIGKEKKVFIIDPSSLHDLLSSLCSPADLKLALGEPSSSATCEALCEQVLACHRVIALLLEDTKEKISAAETLDAGQMAVRVAEYFEECDKRSRSYTVPGLAYAIGFITRKQLSDFVAEKYETLSGYIIARALMRIEEQRNVEILAGNGMMTGHKLDLATNFDWMDTKNKSSKDEDKASTQITQNIINYNSLPPDSMSVDEWQRRFLQQQKAKDAPAIDVDSK